MASHLQRSWTLETLHSVLFLSERTLMTIDFQTCQNVQLVWHTLALLIGSTLG